MFLANREAWPGVRAARLMLAAGASAVDAVEQGIRRVEADRRVRSVGRGGSPNLAGEMECDAAIMDGNRLLAGSVGALKAYLYAVSVARQVMERLPHVMLVGEGAARFAREIRAESAEMLTQAARTKHTRWLKRHVPADVLRRWPHVPLARFAWESGRDYAAGGTVIFLARDRRGSIAAGASTSGWARKYPGRLGDSPIVGAGLYADNRYGACGCTHTGEMTMRALTARSVILYMKSGASVGEACCEAMRDLLELRGGRRGPVVIHAIDRNGEPYVLATRRMGRTSSFYHWAEGERAVRHSQAATPSRVRR
jgi:L-asparaginase